MNYEYVKVLLYAYPSLPKIAEAVGAGAENKAFLSFRAHGSAFDVAERVADEIFTRRNLERVHAALNVILSGLSDQEKFMLEYKYFRRRRELSRYGGSDCSERTYFRRQQRLLKKIAEALIAQGWTEEGYMELFGGFAPFRKLYTALCEGRERKFTQKRKCREICFLRTEKPVKDGA